ncbi:MAG: carbohydrate binding domain-containing protein [Saprospiraceae bacterium]|nr:carbohydrate binding domain-containing protein [Saprospiraceae bacterium]
MKIKSWTIWMVLSTGLVWSCGVLQNDKPTQTITIDIDAKAPLVPIQPTMFGIFFEDINSGADGGLYAELVKNRSFEFEYPWMGWRHLPNPETRFNTINELTIMSNAQNHPNNTRYVRIDKRDTSADFGFQNEGFDGMGIKQNDSYDFSFWARNNTGNVRVKADLVDTSGHILGSVELEPNESIWKKWEGTIKSNSTEEHARLNVYFLGQGQLDIDHISVFPQDTWKGRKGGLRKDLVQLLADMKPGFMRFPGGCIVEGRTLDERYQWKKTLGNVEDRKLMINRWNMEFKHRPAPDYFQSFGLGFFEYFQLAEDIGAEPVPIISCGLACQFNSSETVPMDELDPYIQDALDLIEFANGDISSKWGSIRSAMGHPNPFNMKFIGVGNEQWGQEYFERYAQFAKAIKSSYPDMNIISGTGPFAEGELFESAEKELTKLKPEIVDEHYYKNPQWFLDNAGRYDNYDRARYKIFAGEYAAQSVATVSPDNRNTWECALAEASFMTGLERNADVVYMSSYAPLFAHVNRWQWTPDLIWFDNLTAFGTANYYVQKMYATNTGTKTLSIKSNGQNMTGQHGLYGTASVDEDQHIVIVKIVNVQTQDVNVEIKLQGMVGQKTGRLISLHNKDLQSFNTIKDSDTIVPEEKDILVHDGSMTLKLAGSSFEVIRIPSL